MGNHVEDLNKYAVRIKEGQRVLGSGVLWKPKSCEQNHIYVFTAAHVIKNHENVEVEFWHHENVVKLSVEKNMIAISKAEYDICEFLAKNRGQIFSKEQILEKVLGYDSESSDSTIITHIKNIRTKLSSFEYMPIKTVWGIGYKWEE